MADLKYDHRGIETKWQAVWEKEKVYTPNLNSKAKPFYNLWMFPYPSAEGLHAGHAFASTGSDVYGRFLRMKGLNVFQPIGYDSFGIHSENYAIKINELPQKVVLRTTGHYEQQLKSLGHGYDWTRTVTTSSPEYYKWTQWVFVQMFKHGLAYKKKTSVNWCPSCKTVLADEQVVTPAQAGKEPKTLRGETVKQKEGVKICERCATLVEKKQLSQWLFRITDYADRLLSGHDQIDWSQRVITAQKEWIGKKTGAKIIFNLSGKDRSIIVFTTRPDTLYGTTFLAASPLYVQNNLMDLIGAKYNAKVTEYIKKHQKNSDTPEQNKFKTGAETGIFVINPATGRTIPLFVADYVLDDYATGVVMGVPAHDQRDYDFAKKYNLEIKPVVEGGDIALRAYDGAGKIINSGNWNGLMYPKNYDLIVSDIENKKWGRQDTQYHLRDWIISRQRYWGAPIPMIYCAACAASLKSYRYSKEVLHPDQSDWEAAGWFPAAEEGLPVSLPDISDYQPEGTGKGPLSKHAEFWKVRCPNCRGQAERETDVCDTFLDSSWYFLRYPSVGSVDADNCPFNRLITNKWLPVNLYFGGAEHSVLHLMYSRFINLVLFDLKYLKFPEPFSKFYAHGLLIKDGAKMSKSRGNVINPDSYIQKYGADTLRMYLLFIGPMDASPDFRDAGIEGMNRFIGRLWKLLMNKPSVILSPQMKNILLTKMHQTIKNVTDDIEIFHYNTAISSIMIYVNFLEGLIKSENSKTQSNKQKVDADSLASDFGEAQKILCLLIAPFAPHLAEEVWQNRFVKNSKGFSTIHYSQWPKYDSLLIKEDTIDMVVQVNGKLRATFKLPMKTAVNQPEAVKIAQEDNGVAKWFKGKKIIKVIFLPGKLINFVAR